ncbi:hypothetical protein AB8A31_09840 [Tardiphaga sp. 804_B3_N1_9]|uniref:hypothetical protein n=1 Tax=Tardiphaga TaxID=1395974 RepID=UPI001586DDA8|nr:hypothetical protein [Tardiphaga robiniae]NUU39886.1 hypothetical protein [Tardiphaga robiniae]
MRVGDRVHWKNDRADAGTVAESTWSGVVIKWDNRGPQTIMHNDMVDVSVGA